MKKRDLTVFVYRNLAFPKKVMWSIKEVRTGIVIGHSEEVFLKDCSFIINKSGQKRVRESGRKNVHAGIKGKLLLARNIGEPANCTLAGREGLYDIISYNPYVNDTFVTSVLVSSSVDGSVRRNESVFDRKYVLLSTDGNKSVVFGSRTI